jgi:hypothetical protein
MTSSVGDYGGYSKSDGARLAEKDPETARKTANNYMLYAMQNSMTSYGWASNSYNWGGLKPEITCKDNFANCYSMTWNSNQCCDVRTKLGNWLDGQCCGTCSLLAQTNECKNSLSQ